MKNNLILRTYLNKKIFIFFIVQVSRVTVSAKEAVEALGGSVRKVFYNKLGLRALIKPEWFAKKRRLLPKPARPPPKQQDKVDSIGRLPAPTKPIPFEPKEEQPAVASSSTWTQVSFYFGRWNCKLFFPFSVLNIANELLLGPLKVWLAMWFHSHKNIIDSISAWSVLVVEHLLNNLCKFQLQLGILMLFECYFLRKNR